MKAAVATLLLSVLVGITVAPAADPEALARSRAELRRAVGAWEVVTEFLAPDGSVQRSARGSYRFHWVSEPDTVAGVSEVQGMPGPSELLFYVDPGREVIEMVSVGPDGRRWVMTGPLGGDTRYTEPYGTQDGGSGQLRFTTFDVATDSFHSRMEYSQDGGESWLPGNHQSFVRVPDRMVAAAADGRPCWDRDPPGPPGPTGAEIEAGAQPGRGDTRPELLAFIAPDVQAAGLEDERGTVVLDVLVSHLGRVERLCVERSAGAQLDSLAAAAAFRQRFEPARKAGVAVPAWARLPYRFEGR